MTLERKPWISAIRCSMVGTTMMEESHVLGTPTRKAGLFVALQAAGWTAFGAVMLVWGLEHWSLQDALANKAILVATGVAITLGMTRLYRWGRTAPLAAFAALVIVASFGLGLLWAEVHDALFLAYIAATDGRGFELRWADVPIGTVLFNGFVLLAWSLLYVAVDAWIALEEQRARARRAEELAREARLRALRFQLEPHFLFNALNAVSTLVVEGRNAAATRMLARLGDFLRLTLDAADSAEVSIEEELEFVRRYLEIERVRFGDRLSVTIEASPEASRGLVPVLLLQPLVENAVRHGALRRDGGGSVSLTVSEEGGMLRVAVTDDGPGFAGDPVERAGVGLANTAARLAELYGDRARLSLDPSPEGGVVATVEIPFRPAPEAAWEPHA
jgi:two-component system, LytTR family, sensor kinase